MNKNTKLVYDVLKPRASALGFNKEELESVAESIADNLSFEEDASEETINVAVSKAVDAALPILAVSQRNANRIITKSKEDADKAQKEKAEREAQRKAEEEARAKAEKEAKEKADAEAKAEEERKAKYEQAMKKVTGEEEPKEEPKPEEKKSDGSADYLKLLREENEKLSAQLKSQFNEMKKLTEQSKKRDEEFKLFKDEFNNLKATRVKETREKRLDDLLKDTGIFGERIKKNYTRMTFDKDEDFDTFLADVRGDIEAFNQERANKGLEKMGISAAGGDTPPDTPEVMSDADIDALAEKFV